MIGSFRAKCPRAIGATGPVKLEREEMPRAASVSLAGDVSQRDIGAGLLIYNARNLNGCVSPWLPTADRVDTPLEATGIVFRRRSVTSPFRTASGSEALIRRPPKRVPGFRPGL